MNPLFKLVAITLLTAHPDKYKKTLAFTSSSDGSPPNKEPPAGVSMIQLVRTIQRSGAELLRQILAREERQQRLEAKRLGGQGDGARTQNQNQNQQQQQEQEFGGGGDAELSMQVGGDDDDDDDNNNNNFEQLNAGGQESRFNAIWPASPPDVWVPGVVQQLLQMGAVVNENAGIENRRPQIRLTPTAYHAAWLELVNARVEAGATTLAPSEVERRSNKKRSKRDRLRRQHRKSAKREENTARGVVGQKKLSKIKSKAVLVRQQRKKGAKKR